MSQRELHRLKVIDSAVHGRVTVAEAARLPELTCRQTQRLKQRHDPASAEWVRHGDRGKQKPRRLPAMCAGALWPSAKGKYAGLNDTQFTEKLNEEEGIAVSRETVRRTLRAARLASPQKRAPSVTAAAANGRRSGSPA